MFQLLFNRSAFLAGVLLLLGCSQESEIGTTNPGTGLPMTDSGIPLSTNSDAVFAMYQKARKFADRGDFVLANQAARQLTEAYPDFAGGWLMLSNTSLSGQQFVQASKRAMETAEAGGTAGEQIWAAINRDFVANNTDKALDRAVELTATYPHAGRGWIVLAGVQSARAEHEAARKSLLKALELTPTLTVAYTTLGLSYLNNTPRDLGLAERYLLRAVDLQSDEDNAWINLGDLRRAAGHLEQARSDYTKAMILDPENAIAPVKRGHVNSFLGHYGQARSDYDAGIRVAKELSRVTLTNYRAFVSLHEGKHHAAVAELEALLASISTLEMPDDQKWGARIFTLTNLADLGFHYQMHDLATACVDQLTEALLRMGEASEDPDFARGQKAFAAYWRGKLAARSGRFEDALAYATQYQLLLEGDANPRSMELYQELLGLTALLQHHYEAAITHYRQANLSTSAGSGDIKNAYMLAQALAGAGYREESADQLRKIADWNFNSVWFAMLRKSLAGQT